MDKNSFFKNLVFILVLLSIGRTYEKEVGPLSRKIGEFVSTCLLCHCQLDPIVEYRVVKSNQLPAKITASQSTT